jgi:hypothetical protein
MPDCPASSQFGTGMKKTNDARRGPVPDEADAVRHFYIPVLDENQGCLNTDAGISFLDADAQLCQPPRNRQSGVISECLIRTQYCRTTVRGASTVPITLFIH